MLSYVDKRVSRSFNTANLSSDVNFCEKNTGIMFIEPFNTISSFALSLGGVIGLINMFFKRELNVKNFKWIFAYFNLFFIGLASAYFHATLSELGHFLDIYSIACILTLGVCTIKNISILWIALLLLFEFLLCMITPVFSIIAMMIKGVYLKSLIENKITEVSKDMDKTHYKMINKEYTQTKRFFVIALVCWFTDVGLCNYLGVIHLHFVFHIIMGRVTYKIIELVQDLLSHDLP